jgi:iron complex outermembrane receptor protein
MKYLLVLCCILLQYNARTYSQSVHFYGKVVGENMQEMLGATILLNQGAYSTISDNHGHFSMNLNAEGKYLLEVSYLGYEKYTDSVFIVDHTKYDITLDQAFQTLKEVMVTDNYAELRHREESRSIEVVDDQFLKMNMGGSLMQSLERLPGISAQSIGSGQSKPVIRGLGFNRVLVSENGIKHEAQQWGVDHGLEIDQYAVERIEVIKGPASLQFGSDAIGGVVQIENYKVPAKKTFGAKLDLTGKSNTAFMGGSVSAFARRDKAFFSARYSRSSYADIKVPTNEVTLYDFTVPLKGKRVRNTAGNEQNIHFTIGFLGQRYTHKIVASRVESEAGFFANAAGLAPLNPIYAEHDASYRDIIFPKQNVTHLKLVNKGVYRFAKSKIEFEVGVQQNKRQEWFYYTQDAGEPFEFPDTLSFPKELEKEFEKQHYQANLRWNKQISELQFTFGISSEYQKNDINGRNFLIPAYTQFSAAAFHSGTVQNKREIACQRRNTLRCH